MIDGPYDKERLAGLLGGFLPDVGRKTENKETPDGLPIVTQATIDVLVNLARQIAPEGNLVYSHYEKQMLEDNQSDLLDFFRSLANQTNDELSGLLYGALLTMYYLLDSQAQARVISQVPIKQEELNHAAPKVTKNGLPIVTPLKIKEVVGRISDHPSIQSWRQNMRSEQKEMLRFLESNLSLQTDHKGVIAPSLLAAYAVIRNQAKSNKLYFDMVRSNQETIGKFKPAE